MALAIARSVDSHTLAPIGNRHYYDPFTAHGQAFSDLGFQAAGSPEELLSASQVVVLAVKPQLLPDVLPYLANNCTGKCVVSILAGVATEKLREGIGHGAAILRVMPNTPLMVGHGAAVIAQPEADSQAWLPPIRTLFTASGIAEVLPEPLIDAATGLNGSSPAYFFRFAETMARWGEQQGIPYGQALRLSVWSMQASAMMMGVSYAAPDKTPPPELLSRVTSPGGTTLAALSAFDEHHFEVTVQEALNRCMVRSKELGM